MRFTAPLALDTRMHVDVEGVQLLGPLPVEPGGEEDEEGSVGERGVWTVKLPSPRTGVDPDPDRDRGRARGDARRPAQSRPVDLPSFVPLAEDGEPLPEHGARPRRAAQPAARGGGREPRPGRGDRPARAARRSSGPTRSSSPSGPTTPPGRYVSRSRATTTSRSRRSSSRTCTSTRCSRADGRATTEAYLVVRNNDRQNLELTLPAERDDPRRDGGGQEPCTARGRGRSGADPAALRSRQGPVLRRRAGLRPRRRARRRRSASRPRGP